MLKFYINEKNNQVLQREGYETIVADSKQFLEFIVSFPESWEQLTKTINFKRGDVDNTVINIEHNVPKFVPQGALGEVGNMDVSVVGVKDGLTIATTTVKSVPVSESGYKGFIPDPTPETQDPYSQFIELVGEIIGPNENERVASENTRISQEDARVLAEAERQEVEATRIAQMNLAISKAGESADSADAALVSKQDAKTSEDNAKASENLITGALEEVENARGGKVDLNTRLNSVDAQLADITQDNTVMHNNENGAIVSFMFDDAHIRDYTVLKPIFVAEGVPNNVCAITRWTDNIDHTDRLTSLQLKELSDLGWGIESHTASHANLGEISLSEAEIQISESKQFLKNILGKDPCALVYPYGSYNIDVRGLVRKYHKCGISVSVDDNDTPVRQFALYRVEGLGETYSNLVDVTLEDVKSRVDIAVASGSWLIIKGHTSYDAWGLPQTASDMTALIQYIKSLNIPIVTIEDGLKMKGNILDSGDYETPDYIRIGKDGKVVSPLLNSKQLIDLTVTALTPPSYFSRGTTINAFMSNETIGLGFPTEIAGTLITIRPDLTGNGDYTTHQTWKDYSTERKWGRQWNVTTSLWNAWTRIDGMYSITKDLTITSETSLSVFPVGITENHYINSEAVDKNFQN